MHKSREEIMANTLAIFHRLADDWEYSGEITPQTLLFTDLGLQSLDVVVLAMSIQEHYGRPLPFADLFTDMAARGIRDISVSEWVDFLYEHLNSASRSVTR